MTNAIATLNVVDTPAGQTAAAAALAAVIQGQPGTFGMNGDVPVLPPGLAGRLKDRGRPLVSAWLFSRLAGCLIDSNPVDGRVLPPH